MRHPLYTYKKQTAIQFLFFCLNVLIKQTLIYLSYRVGGKPTRAKWLNSHRARSLYKLFFLSYWAKRAYAVSRHVNWDTFLSNRTIAFDGKSLVIFVERRNMLIDIKNLKYKAGQRMANPFSLIVWLNGRWDWTIYRGLYIYVYHRFV